MHVDANGRRLWFDVEGAGLVPDARLELLEGAAHFPWMDVPETYWPLINGFLASAS